MTDIKIMRLLTEKRAQIEKITDLLKTLDWHSVDGVEGIDQVKNANFNNFQVLMLSWPAYFQSSILRTFSKEFRDGTKTKLYNTWLNHPELNKTGESMIHVFNNYLPDAMPPTEAVPLFQTVNLFQFTVGKEKLTVEETQRFIIMLLATIANQFFTILKNDLYWTNVMNQIAYENKNALLVDLMDNSSIHWHIVYDMAETFDNAFTIAVDDLIVHLINTLEEAVKNPPFITNDGKVDPFYLQK